MRFVPLLFALVGCFNTDAGKTLVYALNGEPESMLDRSVCGTGVGLRVPLGISQSLSYSVAPDGRDALLGTCSIDDTGVITECFLVSPEVVLTIADDGALIGTNEISVEIADSDCSGATLDSNWRIALDGDGMVTTVTSTWHLDSTAECEDFEADLILSSTNGLGIEDCVLTHTLRGDLAARCTAVNGLNCKAP